MTRLRQMFKTTAVRLTVLYTVLFGLLAVGVVAYISLNTGRLLINQFQITVDEEIREIARFSRRAGIRRLVPMIERRSRRPGANLYLVADAQGKVIAGNVREIDEELLASDGWLLPPFEYRGYDDRRRRHAIARVLTLPGDLRLLVGRDTGDADRFRRIVARASTISLGVMVLTGLLLWFFVGRRALKHIDSVSESSKQIIAGDLSQRLPLSGSGDEFDRLAGGLNELIARIEKLNSGVRTMSDSIAHDLKTPLTRLRNRAEAGLNTKGKSREKAMHDIINDADGMIRTFDALLMISQVDSGARTASFEPVELAPVLRDVFELFEPSAEEAGVKLNLEIDDEVSTNGNRELIAQCVTNLLDNALKYGADNGDATINLRLKKADGASVISVEDNGNGIALEDQEAALERFGRLEKSRSKPGSGLGLALVEAVMSLHGGRLEMADLKPGLAARLIFK